ncbi:unnamed protein product [Caretta caretta]
MTLFCEEHEEAIYPQCKESQAHRTHNVFPIDGLPRNVSGAVSATASESLCPSPINPDQSGLCLDALTPFLLPLLVCPDALSLPAEAVTLDLENPRVLVSPDQKSVEWDVEWKDLSQTHKRFDFEECVLGNVGRHYWEADIGAGENWTVGGPRESVEKKGVISFKPQEGFWALQQ